jgi:dopamine receptor D2
VNKFDFEAFVSFGTNFTDCEWNTSCSLVNGTNSTGSDGDDKTPRYWALILLLFPLLTLFGNILVVLAVYRERSLQTVTNYFIVSLAIADCVVAVLVMPLAVYVEVRNFFLFLCIVFFATFILYIYIHDTGGVFTNVG